MLLIDEHQNAFYEFSNKQESIRSIAGARPGPNASHLAGWTIPPIAVCHQLGTEKEET